MNLDLTENFCLYRIHKGYKTQKCSIGSEIHECHSKLKNIKLRQINYDVEVFDKPRTLVRGTLRASKSPKQTSDFKPRYTQGLFDFYMPHCNHFIPHPELREQLLDYISKRKEKNRRQRMRYRKRKLQKARDYGNSFRPQISVRDYLFEGLE